MNDALGPRTRQVLYLRVAGYTGPMIAETLGMPRRTVYKHLQKLRRTFLPGLSSTDAPSNVNRGFLMAYVLGALDAGATIREIREQLDIMQERVTQAPAAMRSKQPDLDAEQWQIGG